MRTKKKPAKQKAELDKAAHKRHELRLTLVYWNGAVPNDSMKMDLYRQLVQLMEDDGDLHELIRAGKALTAYVYRDAPKKLYPERAIYADGVQAWHLTAGSMFVIVANPDTVDIGFRDSAAPEGVQ